MESKTEDEWRLAVRKLLLHREQREYHSFRELIDQNAALASEVKLLRQQLADSHAFVVLEDGPKSGDVMLR